MTLDAARRRTPFAVAAVGVVLVLTGCGGGGSDAEVVASAGDALAYDQESWTAPAGEVTVEFETTGAVPHSYVVLPSGTDISATVDAAEALLAIDLQGGASGTETATLEAGTYPVVCTVPGHLEAGMTGTLTITG